MIKIVVTAVMFSALAFNAASAKTATMRCSGDNMMKLNNLTTAMPDGEQKTMVQKEIGMANTAMSKGDMRDCHAHMMMPMMGDGTRKM